MKPMPKRRPFIAGLLALPFLSHFLRADEEATTKRKPAFEVGEKLTYSLGWQFIVAGHAGTDFAVIGIRRCAA